MDLFPSRLRRMDMSVTVLKVQNNRELSVVIMAAWML